MLGNFKEVYLSCSPEACAKRDYKGHYAKAKDGQYEHFVGITEPYECSDDPDLSLDTANQDIEDCASVLLAFTLSAIVKSRAVVSR